MQLYTLTGNAVIVIHSGVDYLFSCETLSAIYPHGNSYVYSRIKVNKATERHVRMFCEYVRCEKIVRLADGEFYDKVG